MVWERRGWPFRGFLEGKKHTGDGRERHSVASIREHWDPRKAAWQAGGTGRVACRKGPLSHPEGRRPEHRELGEGTPGREQRVFTEHLLRARHCSISEQKQTESPAWGLWPFSGQMATLHTQGSKPGRVRDDLEKQYQSRVSGQEASPGSRRSDKTSRELSWSPQSVCGGLGRERAGSAAAYSVV